MTAKELIEKLPIISENIMAEAAIQPQLFIDAARYRVDKMRAQNQAGMELEQYKAGIALRIRNKKNAAGEKLSESALKERVELNKNVQILRQQLNEAYAREEFSKLLVEAFRMRSKAIHIIADAQAYEGRSGGFEVEQLEQKRRLKKRARDLENERQRVNEDDD